MRSPGPLLLVALIALAAVPPPGGAQTATAPSSLVVGLGPLFFSADGSLSPGNATAGPCGPTLAPNMNTASGDFTLQAPPANGSYYLGSSVTVTLRYTAPSAGGVGSPLNLTAGFNASVELLFGSQRIGPVAQNVAQTAVGEPRASTHEFAVPEGINATSGQFKVHVTLTGSPPASGAPPAPVQNVALKCGTEAASIVDSFSIVRGQVGDGDIDGDGLPDSADDDKDGDGASNADEAAVQCTVRGNPVDFASNPRLRPGDNDGDNDGYSDERECAAGTDPLAQLSVPPPPKSFPWALVIFLLLLLIAIAVIVFYLMTYGRAAAITLVSASELIIQPGTEGKYQLQVSNLRKKGNAINFQLSASGAPDGWDAKLSHDHAVLDPVGGAKNAETVWLTVEAPEHSDPESAVVTVKAIALNAAGRKDTLKLPAKAETTTSINVPPNAVVPVKRGSPVKLRGEKEAAKAESAAPAPLERDRPVIDIEGVGEVYAKKLEKMGVTTVQQLQSADPDAVAKKTGAPVATVRQWQAMADLIDVLGVGPQVAELLVRSGVNSIAELAAADAKELAAAIERTNAAREVPIQGGPAGLKSVKNWIKAAKAHPKAAASAAPPPSAAPAGGAESPAAAPPPGKPQVQVGGLQHSPPSFRAGEEVKSSVTVTNSGSDPQALKLSLFVNDALADAQTVSVKPGKSKEVKFKWTAQERNRLNIRGELVAG